MRLASTELKTERIYLREFQLSDWQEVHKYASQERVCRYQPWGPNSLKESQSFVKQVLVDSAKEPRTRYALAINNKEDRLIGAGELNIRDAHNKKGEIGYIINPEYWGKGIATDAATLIIGFGFHQLKLHRIYATCDPRNIGSIRVLEKAGMTKEGRIRGDLLMKDEWRDSLLFSVLENEWV
ncbi:GNAT family N-acetyltransferase [Neobacillus massiliamazoniensis]|uniref:Acetyltransferase n=1 Tax=Neobacillus massiliamazoniensis TaxID=1499688 RepID=A0A0U1NZE4_9BACI|nr:GNAT family protein [Neobacillus massiliamazoniensis]CRK83394.1 acetyltransferase [Neobacillus massiliamazoniensis]